MVEIIRAIYSSYRKRRGLETGGSLACTDGFRFAQPILRPARERIALPAQCGAAAAASGATPDLASAPARAGAIRAAGEGMA